MTCNRRVLTLVDFEKENIFLVKSVKSVSTFHDLVYLLHLILKVLKMFPTLLLDSK